MFTKYGFVDKYVFLERFLKFKFCQIKQDYEIYTEINQ